MKLKDWFKGLVSDKKKLALLIGIIVILVIVIVVLVNIFGNGQLMSGISNADGRKFENEYEKLNGEVSEDGKTYPEVNISSSNVMKYASTEEVLNIFNNKEDAVIYFGYSSCLYCRSAVQVLCDTAATMDIDTIYYLDIEETDDKYNDLLSILDEKFTIEEDGEKKIYSPLVVFVARGDIVSYNKGTLFSQEDPYQPLDKDQVAGLSEIYKYGITDVLNSMNNR